MTSRKFCACLLALFHMVLGQPLYGISEKARRVKEWKGEIKGQKLPPPFDAAADDVFYREHARQVMPGYPNAARLRRQPDIRQYPFRPNVNKIEQERLHAEFAKKRVRAKSYPADRGGTGQHPDLTQPAVEFIQRQKDFVDDFVGFLKAHFRYGYYEELEKRIVNASRGQPTAEYPQGRPTLDQKIRRENRNFVIHLRDTRDPLYNPIKGYLDYVKHVLS